MATKQKILIVDDDNNIAELVSPLAESIMIGTSEV